MELSEKKLGWIVRRELATTIRWSLVTDSSAAGWSPFFSWVVEPLQQSSALANHYSADQCMMRLLLCS
jgi:hypothetical protein